MRKQSTLDVGCSAITFSLLFHRAETTTLLKRSIPVVLATTNYAFARGDDGGSSSNKFCIFWSHNFSSQATSV
eukprot:3185816-Pleurochrysis_carterae.AAC.1